MLVAGLALSLVFAAPVAEKPKLILLDLAAAGVEPQVSKALTEAVASEIAARGVFQVMSSGDVQTLLGVERQKQMLGCNEASSCLTELGGAIGARFVMSGSVAQLGPSFQLSLQTLDTRTTQPVGRSSRIGKDLGELRQLVPWVVAEAAGTPLPPPPSRLLPYSVIAAGGLSVVLGGVAGFNALARDEVISAELQNGKANPAGLRSASDYAYEAQVISRQKIQAVVALGLGVGLVALGLWINPPDVPTTKAATASVVFAGNGVAVAGGF